MGGAGAGRRNCRQRTPGCLSFPIPHSQGSKSSRNNPFLSLRGLRILDSSSRGPEVGSKLPCGQLTAPGSLNSRGFSHRASVGATLKCVCPYTQLQTAGEMAQWLG